LFFEHGVEEFQFAQGLKEHQIFGMKKAETLTQA